MVRIWIENDRKRNRAGHPYLHLASRQIIGCQSGRIGSDMFSILRAPNVRVLSEALVGADRQKPLVGVSISGCLVSGCSY